MMSDLLVAPAYTETVTASSTESLLDVLTPPRYTPSPPAPDYSSEPKRDELTLQEARRPISLPSGSFVTTTGPLTLEIAHQVDGASTPTLHPRGRLSGTLAIGMRDRSSITAITLTLNGRMAMEAGDSGSDVVVVLKDKHTLWEEEDAPSLIPLDIAVPSTFVDKDGKTQPLPPSCDFACDPMVVAAPISVQVTYSLIIVVERSRRHGLFSQTKSLSTAFDFVPRTRPDRGIIPNPSFFSTMKTSPEEWHQSVSEIPTRASSTVQPLKSHLFLPAGKVYWIGAAVPFHLSITGSAPSQRTLFPPEGEGSTRSSSAQVNVKILRQISVEVRKQRAIRNVVIGRATLHSVPPPAAARGGQLDWDGVLTRSELRMDASSTVCGFNVRSVVVKDFVVLEIIPANPTTSPFMPHQNPNFVRFTTEPYSDNYGPDQPS